MSLSFQRIFIVLCVTIYSLGAHAAPIKPEDILSRGEELLHWLGVLPSTPQSSTIDSLSPIDRLTYAYGLWRAAAPEGSPYRNLIAPEHLVYLEGYCRFHFVSHPDEHIQRFADLLVDLYSETSGNRVSERAPLEPAIRTQAIADLAEFESHIEMLKSNHKALIEVAIRLHGDQLYADHPYIVHLRMVRDDLKIGGFGPHDSYEGLLLGTAALFHDALEDTDLTFEQLVRLTGREIALIAFSVTKVRGDEIPGGMTEEDATFQRILSHPLGPILKLADRSANVRFGLSQLFSGIPSKVHKYFASYQRFRATLYRAGIAEALWARLDALITNPTASFAMTRRRMARPIDVDEWDASLLALGVLRPENLSVCGGGMLGEVQAVRKGIH